MDKVEISLWLKTHNDIHILRRRLVDDDDAEHGEQSALAAEVTVG